MEKNFIYSAEKHYFVFTDSKEIDFEKNNQNIHRIYQEDLGWPDNTLLRFTMFLGIKEDLSLMDYLFFFNANLIVLEKISSEEFLPKNNEKLVATLHPGFYNKKRKSFTYDRNKKSTAYISKNEGINYFAGGLNGGITQAFLEAICSMSNKIDTDTKNNVVAKWHDESHWNRYLIGRNDIKILTPSFLYPINKDLPFKPIILIRDKNNYGGHHALRNKRNNYLNRLLVILKILFYKIKKK